MRVDERVRGSVAFVGIEANGRFTPLGTALLGLAIYEDMGNTVAVTAAHVIDSISGEYVWLRVNRKDGEAGTIKISKAGAITFKDRAIDIAILPVSIDTTVYDLHVLPLQSSAWKWQVDDLGEPDHGDEVCVVGLYTSHYGHSKNLPVVRVGHIAAMPEEKVMTDQGYVHGYLIECHSIAGLSGSPVYWNVPQLRVVNGVIQKLDKPNYVPLGILIGYHVVETREDQIVVPQFQQPPEEREIAESEKEKPNELNTGFAVVIPIQRVYEIFESEPIQKIMRENVDYARQKSGYRPASAKPPADAPSPPSNDANPTHREDFTRLVGAASRKPPQED